MTAPKVSICIPAYNRLEMLLDAITSVRNQTYGDWELVIVHDGINPTIREAVASINEPRIKFIENTQALGVPGNWNRCVQEARGELVQILPDDDALCRAFLSKAVRALDEHPQAGFVQTGGFNCDERLRPALSFTLPVLAGFHTGIGALAWQFEHLRCMPACLLFRKSTLASVGVWRTDYHDDWATILKVAYRHGFYYVAEDLCGVRAHAQNYAKRLGQAGRDGIGDMLNQTLDVFGSCLPTDLDLLALQKRCLKKIGSRSAAASLRALAQGRLQDGYQQLRRAARLAPFAYLGPGIYAVWKSAEPNRRLADILKKSERISAESVIKWNAMVNDDKQP